VRWLRENVMSEKEREVMRMVVTGRVGSDRSYLWP
jgi:hypothetical protein